MNGPQTVEQAVELILAGFWTSLKFFLVPYTIFLILHFGRRLPV